MCESKVTVRPLRGLGRPSVENKNEGQKGRGHEMLDQLTPEKTPPSGLSTGVVDTSWALGHSKKKIRRS